MYHALLNSSAWLQSSRDTRDNIANQLSNLIPKRFNNYDSSGVALICHVRDCQLMRTFSFFLRRKGFYFMY